MPDDEAEIDDLLKAIEGVGIEDDKCIVDSEGGKGKKSNKQKKKKKKVNNVAQGGDASVEYNKKEVNDKDASMVETIDTDIKAEKTVFKVKTGRLEGTLLHHKKGISVPEISQHEILSPPSTIELQFLYIFKHVYIIHLTLQIRIYCSGIYVRRNNVFMRFHCVSKSARNHR